VIIGGDGEAIADNEARAGEAELWTPEALERAYRNNGSLDAFNSRGRRLLGGRRRRKQECQPCQES
jgi:hypothetical protein